MAKVSKIIVKIGDRELELTFEEAIALRSLLNDLLKDNYKPTYPIPRTPYKPIYMA